MGMTTAARVLAVGVTTISVCAAVAVAADTARPDFTGEDKFTYTVRLGFDKGSTDYFYVVRVRVR